MSARTTLHPFHARNPTRLSRFLSLVLRHDPGRIGLQLDADGWTEVTHLLPDSGIWLIEHVPPEFLKGR